MVNTANPASYRHRNWTRDDVLLRVVIDDQGCWIWQRSVDQRWGYGLWHSYHNVEGEQVHETLAHRTVYRALIGPIPKGLTLDHLCQTKRCVNPDHLEPVTIRVNILRSPTNACAVNARKTHCPKGHSYSVRSSDGGRICPTCIATRGRRIRGAA